MGHWYEENTGWRNNKGIIGSKDDRGDQLSPLHLTIEDCFVNHPNVQKKPKRHIDQANLQAGFSTHDFWHDFGMSRSFLSDVSNDYQLTAHANLKWYSQINTEGAKHFQKMPAASGDYNIGCIWHWMEKLSRSSWCSKSDHYRLFSPFWGWLCNKVESWVYMAYLLQCRT